MSEVLPKRLSRSVNGSVGPQSCVVDRQVAYRTEVLETSGPLDHCFDLAPLGSVALAIKDGTHGTHARTREGVPFLSAKNISAAGTIVWSEDDDRITESEYALIHQSFHLEDGDLLLTIVGSLGRRAIYRGERVTFQRSVAYIRPDAKKCSEQFLFHWFGHPSFQQELARRSNATAQAGLYLGELAKVSVPKCSSQQQSQIARVLDTLDTTIRQTAAIIAKLKQVKQGLLHDLLTRGIDANGELRPPQSQAAHLYKKSLLGWIPTDWSPLDTGQVVGSIVDGPFGSNLKTEHYVDVPGVRVVRLQNIDSGEYNDTERAYVSDEKARSLSRNEVLPGDVLVAALGDDRHHVGRACTYPDGLAAAINKADCFRLRPAADVAIGEFLMHTLNSARAHRQVRGFQQGVTMQRINLGNLRRVKIPVPSVEEQQMICDRLAALQTKVIVTEAMHSKLTRQKSGLMDDLLTGRVRVTPLLEATRAP